MQLCVQGSLLHELINNVVIPLVNTKSQQGHNVGVPNPAKQIQLILPATTAQIVRTRTNNPLSVITSSNGQWPRIYLEFLLALRATSFQPLDRRGNTAIENCLVDTTEAANTEHIALTELSCRRLQRWVLEHRHKPLPARLE